MLDTKKIFHNGLKNKNLAERGFDPPTFEL
jgi:hypothetical protein